MSERDLSNHPLECPNCGCSVFLPTVKKDYGTERGLRSSTGPLACLDCRELVDLDVAIQRVTLEQKRKQLERLEKELNESEGVVYADTSINARGRGFSTGSEPESDRL